MSGAPYRAVVCAVSLSVSLNIISTTYAAEQKNARQPRVGIDTHFGDLVHEADAALKAKRYDDALSKASAALAMNPDPRNAAMLHALRATAFVYKDDIARAKPEAEAAVHLDPTSAPGHFELGLIYRRLGENERAVEADTRAIQLRPNWAQAYNNRGVAYDHLGKHELAIRDYSEALRLNPDHVDAYANRGGAYDSLGKQDKALADYNEALRRNPNVENVHYNRASIANRRGDLNAALADLNVAVRQMPHDPSVLIARGALFHRLKQNDRAVADYRAAAAFPTRTAEDFSSVGYASFILGDYSRAAHVLAEGKRLFPRSPEIIGSYAWLRATSPEPAFRNGNEAVAAAREACELSRWKDFNQIDTLAGAYAELGKFDEALKYQKQAINLRGPSLGPRDEMEEHFHSYQGERPYREEPWR